MNTFQIIMTTVFTLAAVLFTWVFWPKRKTEIRMEDLLNEDAINGPKKLEESISKLSAIMKNAAVNGQRRQIALQLLPSVQIAYPDSSYARQVKTALELADEYLKQAYPDVR